LENNIWGKHFDESIAEKKLKIFASRLWEKFIKKRPVVARPCSLSREQCSLLRFPAQERRALRRWEQTTEHPRRILPTLPPPRAPSGVTR
jgi:hypothetical protein